MIFFDTLELGGYSHGLWALCALKGLVLARFPVIEAIKSAVYVDSKDDLLWFGAYDHKLYVLKLVLNQGFSTNEQLDKKDETTEIDLIPVESLPYKFVQLWSHNCSGSVFASVLEDFKSGRIYVADTGGTLFCIERKSGSSSQPNGLQFAVVWSCRPSGAPLFATPAINSCGNVLVIASVNGSVRGLCPVDGSVIWAFQHSENKPFFSSPRIHNDIIYLGCHDGYCYVFQVMNGELIWKIPSNIQHQNLAPVVSSVFVWSYPLTQAHRGLKKRRVDGILTGTDSEAEITKSAYEGEEYLKQSLAAPILSTYEFEDDNESNSNLKRQRSSCDDSEYISPALAVKKDKNCMQIYFVLVSQTGTVTVWRHCQCIISTITESPPIQIACFQLSAEVFSSPVVFNNQIVLGTRDNRLYCLKLCT